MDPLTAVLDIGKTLTKLSLWTRAGELVARDTYVNRRVAGPAYMALDTEGIDVWLADVLSRFAREGRVAAIVPVGHGAAAAIVRDNQLVVPAMDYEEALPHRAAYEAQRDDFMETGSPSLPNGLNLGAQLDRLEQLDPEMLAGDARILLWPQYWAWRLSGVAASELSSLGCHSDLWRPRACEPSLLAQRRGWARRLPPLRSADAVLGPITSKWVERTGLPADVKVYCGLHDSNAALLAARGFVAIADREATVLSTGTWFVAMRSPSAACDVKTLEEARDCLVNVDPYGKLIPSSRCMGGREVEVLTCDTRRIDDPEDQSALLAAVPAVLHRGARVLPTFAPGVGPFPRAWGRWIDCPADEKERRAAVCLYAALLADVSLDLIGARDRILVEGRFAGAEVFVRALASLRPYDTLYVSAAHTDVSYGALRLVHPDVRPLTRLTTVPALAESLERYREQWRTDVQQQDSTT